MSKKSRRGQSYEPVRSAFAFRMSVSPSYCKVLLCYEASKTGAHDRSPSLPRAASARQLFVPTERSPCARLPFGEPTMMCLGGVR